MKMWRCGVWPSLTVVVLLFFPSYQAKAQRDWRPPLHTEGHRIVDSQNRSVRLASVNWYGFDQKEFVAGGLDHQPLALIVKEIKEMGMNSVRLPWANETFEKNPVVADYAIKANPQFKGKHALDVMDAVIGALAKENLMVILDNHVSRADWCCEEKDGNGLWANAEYPEQRWLEDWKAIVLRYKDQAYVVGADLRNELRSGAQWGGADPTLDWHAAAERSGNAVLEANPKLLVIVEGPDYSTDFRGAAEKPVILKLSGRLVYSPHAYSSKDVQFQSYEEMKQALDARAGFLLLQEPGVPLWVGEFGTCQTIKNCGPDGTPNEQWFVWFVQYLKEKDLSWCYWALNGTQSSGEGRKYDAVETYGLLSPDYKTIAAPDILRLLRTIEQ
jgi:endoglucanase